MYSKGTTAVKIKSIKKVKLSNPIPVYDIEVEDNDNFALANNLVVHNSKDFSDARAAAAWICSTDDPQQTEHYAMPLIFGAGGRRK